MAADLHPIARVTWWGAKLAWRHPKGAFLFVMFVIFWQLLGAMFGVGLLAAGSIAVLVAAMYAVMVTGFRVNQITGTGMPVPSVIGFVKYFASEATETAKLAQKWEKGCSVQGVKWDGQVPKLLNPKYVAFGDVKAKVNVGAIYGDVKTLQSKQLQLQGILGCHDMAIVETDPGKANIHMYFRKPLDSVRTVQELPWPKLDDEMCFAIDRDAGPTSLKYMNTLIGGETGAGKSGVFWAMIADLVRRGVPTELWVCDPKGGMEFGILRKQLAASMAVDKDGLPIPQAERTMIVKDFASTPAGCMQMIKRFEAQMKVRQEANEKKGLRQIAKPTKEEPLCILVIDEFLSLPEVTKDGAASPLGRIATQSRSVLMMAVGLAQAGKLNIIGDVRDLFPQAVCLRVKNAYVTAAFLSVTEADSGAYCSKIPLDKPGTGYLRNREGEIVKFRAPYITDDDAAVLARSEIPEGMLMRRGQAVDEVAVYRAWVGKVLAYIGKSNQPERRRKEHLREDRTKGDCPFCGAFECLWWKHVDRFEVETPWFTNDVIAKAAEEQRIKREKPLMNHIHNGDQSRRRAAAAVLHRKAAEWKLAAAKHVQVGDGEPVPTSTPLPSSGTRWWQRVFKVPTMPARKPAKVREPAAVKPAKPAKAAPPKLGPVDVPARPVPAKRLPTLTKVSGAPIQVRKPSTPTTPPVLVARPMVDSHNLGAE